MSKRFSTVHLDENDNRWLPDGEKIHVRSAVRLRDGSAQIEKQWTENIDRNSEKAQIRVTRLSTAYWRVRFDNPPRRCA
jgi:hypothetical protein